MESLCPKLTPFWGEARAVPKRFGCSQHRRASVTPRSKREAHVVRQTEKKLFCALIWLIHGHVGFLTHAGMHHDLMHTRSQTAHTTIELLALNTIISQVSLGNRI